LSNDVKIGGFRHPSLFSRRGDGGEVIEKINLQNQKRANRSQLAVNQLQTLMFLASYTVIYFNQEKVTGSVGLSNNVKIGGFRHPSLFSRRGDGGEVCDNKLTK